MGSINPRVEDRDLDALSRIGTAGRADRLHAPSRLRRRRRLCGRYRYGLNQRNRQHLGDRASRLAPEIKSIGWREGLHADADIHVLID